MLIKVYVLINLRDLFVGENAVENIDPGVVSIIESVYPGIFDSGIGNSGGNSGGGSGREVEINNFAENIFFPGFHIYEHTSPEICSLADTNCSVLKVIDALNKFGVHPNQVESFIPGEPYKGDVNVPGPWDEDHVRTLALNRNGTQYGVLNVTENNHILHRGAVLRQVVRRGDSLHIQTIGWGNGLFGGFGNSAVPRIWGGVDNNVLQQF